MASKKQAGFTLIEIMLVLGITSALFLIIFAGQRQLRSRAQFDASVNKIISSMADAHNQATAGVKLTGDGSGNTNCAGAPAGVGLAYLFAGVAWSVSDGAPGATFTMDFYATTADHNKLARNGALACQFASNTISIPGDLRVDNPPGGGRRRILFVRDDLGGIVTCTMTNNVVSTNPTVLSPFKSAGCTGPATPNPLTVTFSDADGHTSQVLIEQSGLAKRLN